MAAPRRENDPKRRPQLQDPYKQVKTGYLSMAGHTTPEDIQSSYARNVHRSNEMSILDAHDDFEAGKQAVSEYRKKHNLD